MFSAIGAGTAVPLCRSTRRSAAMASTSLPKKTYADAKTASSVVVSYPVMVDVSNAQLQPSGDGVVSKDEAEGAETDKVVVVPVDHVHACGVALLYGLVVALAGVIGVC